MTKLKSIRLVNFGGYRDTTFQFDSTKQPVALFYGPNGYGKSTVLEAIRIASNPLVFRDRTKGAELYLRPLTYDNDYQTSTSNVKEKRNELYVHAIFDQNGDQRDVVLSNDGFLVNELGEQHNGYSFYADADNPINWAKFQLHSELATKFIEMAEAIYGFECDLDAEVKDSIVEADGSTSTHLFYQDLVISKGKDRVHFCRMSAGEKKIATLIRQLCDPDSLLNIDIVLVDNLEMHVYFKRHPLMLEKLKEHFKGKQLIATTHSGVMVDSVSPMCRYDLEKFRPDTGALQMSNEEATCHNCGCDPVVGKVETNEPKIVFGVGFEVTESQIKAADADKDSLIVAPEGLDLPPPQSDLSAKLAAMFTLSKQKAELEEIAEVEKPKIDLDSYTDVLLPNGMTVKVRKDCHKAQDNHLSMMVSEVAEMDCSDEDEEGNAVVPLVDDGGPAVSEYKPGMLRDLKAKFYPEDQTGAKAQARLNEKVDVPNENPEVFTLDKQLTPWNQTPREQSVWNNLDKWAGEIYSEKEFSPTEEHKLVQVELENGVRIYVPQDFKYKVTERSGVAGDEPEVKAKLEKIFFAATNAAPNRAAAAREVRTNLLRERVYAERAKVQAEEQRVANLTRDTITITPIENPSLLRRAIRTVRRTYNNIAVWWRL